MSAVITEPQVVRCMRVFGGNRTVRQRFELPGLDAFLASNAIGGRRGGDVHYISTCGKGEIVRLLVGDVAGHGASVADVAERFQAFVTKNINRLDQSGLARTLNREFVADTEGGRFVTTLFTSYHRPSGHLVVCNAGHPRPLLYRAATRRWLPLDFETEVNVDALLNLPLGIIHPTDYRQFAVRLQVGDRVVMYTDGLSDCPGVAGTAGEQRMLEAVNDIPIDTPEHMADALREALGMRPGAYEPLDDETLLVVAPSDRPFAPPSVRERLAVLGRMLHVLPVS